MTDIPENTPEPVPATNQAGEGERAAIVSYIRRQSDRGADIGNEKPKGSTARAAFGGGSLALKRVADNIEAGEHVINDNTALATQPATSQEDARGDFGVGQDELVAGLKRALQHPAGDHDGWTDAGMEDAFFRWPVVVNALNEALASNRTATSQEGEGTLANPSTFGKPTFALAATPTPPTLSEDAIRKALDNAQSKLGHVSIDAMNGDNLAVTLCSHFDDGEGDEDENGWTPAASDGCDDTLKAIHAVYVAALARVKAS